MKMKYIVSVIIILGLAAFIYFVFPRSTISISPKIVQRGKPFSITVHQYHRWVNYDPGRIHVVGPDGSQVFLAPAQSNSSEKGQAFLDSPSKVPDHVDSCSLVGLGYTPSFFRSSETMKIMVLKDIKPGQYTLLVTPDFWCGATQKVTTKSFTLMVE